MNIEFVMPSKKVLVPLPLLRFRKRIINIYKNTFPILAALTPNHINVEYTDEGIESVKTKPNIDLLAISINTAFANRGYEIAAAYREKYKSLGKDIKIVFGGSHATVLPDEALQYGDAVIIGEAEEIWGGLLDDCINNNLKKIYPSSRKPIFTNPDRIPIPKREVIYNKSLFTVDTIQFTRGCSKCCEFCSVSTGRNVRYLPLSLIEEDISKTKGVLLALLDDNLFNDYTNNSQYIFEILNLLRKYKKKWFTQMPLDAAADLNLIKQMKVSGCKGVYLGIESIPGTLDGHLNKNRNYDPYSIINNLRENDIISMAGFIFGFDWDDKYVFKKTLDFVNKAKLNFASFHLLTPYPGTPLYKRLLKENRLLYPKHWDLYDTTNVVFKPAAMDARELQEGYWNTLKSFYSIKSIYHRSSEFSLPHIVGNLVYWFGLKGRPPCTPPFLVPS